MLVHIVSLVSLYSDSEKMRASDITRAKMAKTGEVFGFGTQSMDYGVMMSQKSKGCHRQPVSRE